MTVFSLLRKVLLRLVGSAALALVASVAEARSLHWSRLEVLATLDSSGVLNVTEKQSLIFDGDWNGGERWFSDVGVLRFHGIDFWNAQKSQWLPLVRGRLDLTHHYDWVDGRLRWRSRQSDDPPFEQAERTYALKYSLSNVLTESDRGFVLDHDFGLPDRSGMIRDFELRLSLDPIWKASDPSPLILRKKEMGPISRCAGAIPIDEGVVAHLSGATQQLGYEFWPWRGRGRC